MARQTWIQNAFNSGELSPFIAGRTDITRYGAGAETIENFSIRPTGGVTRRSGSRFVLECKDSARKSKLVSFVFSSTQAYILEFGHNVIRVFKDEAVVLSGGVPLEIVTTYTEAELYDLGFAQSNDTLYIVHSAHPTAKLTRTSHTAWTLTDVVFKDGPWLAQNTTDIILTPTGASGSVTVTATGGAPFTPVTDVGRMLRMACKGGASSLTDTKWGWGIITAVASTTSVTLALNVDAPLQTVDGTKRWRLGAFGSAASIGYPSVVTFQEQRLFFAGNPAGPQTVYASKTADFENFALTTDYGSAENRAVIADDNGFTYTIASNQVNVIRWMNPIRALVIGTNNGVWTMQASTPQEAVTPTNVQIRRSTVTGVGAIESVNVDDEVVFVADSYNRAMIVGYQFDKDSYAPLDATLYAEHMGESGFVDIAYAHEPNKTIYLVREDGVLCGLTYMKDQSVIGWARHILGGSFGNGHAVVESVAVIPAPTEDHDQVWLTVKRTINGATVRYVEFFEQEFSSTAVLPDAFFVDCGLSYSGAPATSITGLSHLEGQTVQVLADGGVVPNAVVSGGGFTLATAASKVHAGLAYQSNLAPFKPDTADREGSAQSKAGRAAKTFLRFYRSAEGKIGQSASTLSVMDFRSTDDLMNQPTPLLTDDYDVRIDSQFDLGRAVYVRQDLPLPMNILALVQEIWTGDR